MGDYFSKELEKLKTRFELITEIRNLGLMIGVSLSKPVAADMVLKALEDGLVINKVSDNILRFLPTLVITKSDINKLIKWLIIYMDGTKK